MDRARSLGLLGVVFLLVATSAVFGGLSASQVIERGDVSRGLCVVAGQDACDLAISLAQESDLLIYLHVPETKELESARRAIDEAGYFGTRVFIAAGQSKLHLADNLADVAVVSGRPSLSQAEILRVLRPGGKAMIGDTTIVKSIPPGMDDWTHPYHGSDNNPQSNDKLIVAPYLTQFLAEPRYARLPQVCVTSAGRVFKAFGHVAFKEREEPFLNKLVAFNGYNGTILWQRELCEGVMIHRNTMVATSTALYVGDSKSCKVIDTVTGKLLDEIVPPVDRAGGTFWKWMALEDGVLYAMIGEQEQVDETKRWNRDKHGWPSVCDCQFTLYGVTCLGPAGDLVFVGGADGTVRAIEAATGSLAWKGYTGGAIRMPPTIWEGRAYVGSGDGWVYCFEAKSGRLLWRFQAAPAERLIPVYGTLMSTWPVACGVLVADGTAYTAAGIANYDGTYVYALDARTGAVKWQNNTSGHLDPQAQTGVSVQGHLLLNDGKLYLAGGTSISPAVYDAATGACLNDPGQLANCVSRSPRGWELSLLAGQVVACGKPFYGHPAYDVFDVTVFSRAFMASAGETSVVWASNWDGQRVMGFNDFDREGFARNVANPGNRFEVNWGKLAPSTKPTWSFDSQQARAMALCRNAVLLATDKAVVAIDPIHGGILWEQPLPRPALPWGLAVNAAGRIVVSLEDGRVVCFGAAQRRVAAR